MCIQNVIINGKPVPGKRKTVKDLKILMDHKTNHGKILVLRAKREPGTRAVLHTHPSGGVTCVLSGEMTLYMEGSKAQKAHEGTCYYMPPNMKMLAYNSGKKDAEFIDFFNIKKGDRALTPLECDFISNKGNPYTELV